MKLSALRFPLFAILILSAALTAFADTITGEVVAVADGDTVTVDDGSRRHTVRLNGIDAPESDQAHGPESKRRLADLVFGKQVAVIWSKYDRYNRILGTVTVGPVDANLEQLKAGCAWYFRRYESDVPEIERHLYAAAETEAKARKLGLWSQPNPIAPWDWRDRKASPAASSPGVNPASTPSTRSGEPRSSAGESRRAHSVQCSATTRRGTRCRRMTRSPNGLCWQHGGN